MRIAVTGQKRHGKLSRSTLWTTLNRFAQKACKGELDTLAVAEEVGDEYDPMQEIEKTLDEQHPRSRGGGDPSKRTRYQQNKAKNRLVTVTAPAVSPEEDPMSTSTITIEVYGVDRKQLWLDLDDLEWALRFMYMEFAFHGSGLLCTPVIPQKRKVNDPW